jgi:hypothetical protein
MKNKFDLKAGIFNPRALLGLCLVLFGLFLAMCVFAGLPNSPKTRATNKTSQQTQITGPTTNLSNGITFDHATWNDPIRMIGEPDIVIDHNGGIYVSGPGGSTTQASWFWKSTDKGLQWHLIGCPLKSNCQNGGGDTEITIARNNDVFASDLQTLTCNSALRSYDQGATWLTGEGCFPGTDRQWMGNYDPNASATGRRVYLSANGQTQGCYFLVSTDNGVTYTGTDLVNNPTAVVDPNNGESCIGRFIVNPVNGHIYVPGDGHTWVSTDGGVTFVGRTRPAGVQGNFFANIAIDTAGNLWQGWTADTKAFVSYSTNEGVSWSTPVQVSTGAGSPVGSSPDLHQMLFPWTVVGDPGRVAIVYYATTNNGSAGGFPGDVNALWHVYAAISTNAMSPNPTWTQVQADEHVMHRATVCTGGFPGCLTANSDRSMADFFAVDKDPQGRIFIAYNENSDLSDVSQGAGQEYIGKPIDAVIRLRTGPSLFAAQANLLPDPSPANVAINSASVGQGTVTVSGTHGLPPGNWTSDPAGDALFPVVPVASANHPALDILEASVGDDGTNLNFKLKMADLSATALADAATAGGTPTWMVTWWEGKNGLGPASMTPPYYSHWFVKWLGQNQFVYGKVGSIDSAALGAPTPKALTYIPTGTATGSVVGNVVTITVPLASAGPLVTGDKIDHIIAYSLVEHGDATLSDWADQAKSFSYIIGTPVAGQHLPDGYIEVSLDNFQTSGRATLNPTNNTWTASIPGNGGTVCARQVLAKDLYTSAWDDVQAGPVSCFTIPVPVPSGVVSRMTHGSAGTFDIDMPLAGTRGIECRNGGATNDYTLVFTFPNNLTSVIGATVTNHNPTNGTGTVSSSSIGPNPNRYTVNLTNVSNAQYLTVTLNGVLDATGATGDVTGPQMGVLLGDANASARVDSADVSSVRQQTLQTITTSNFRNDINASGRIDAADVSIARQQTLTSLP